MIYRISATNWPNVFSGIRRKIDHLANNPQDEGDITELLYVIYSLINKDRLIEVLQRMYCLSHLAFDFLSLMCTSVAIVIGQHES